MSINFPAAQVVCFTKTPEQWVLCRGDDKRHANVMTRIVCASVTRQVWCWTVRYCDSHTLLLNPLCDKSSILLNSWLAQFMNHSFADSNTHSFSQFEFSPLHAQLLTLSLTFSLGQKFILLFTHLATDDTLEQVFLVFTYIKPSQSSACSLVIL